MSDSEKKTPSRAEVFEQLRKMLASPRFTSTARQSSILRVVVKKNLARKEITEKDLAEAVLGVHHANSHNIRQHTSDLRKTISAYYQEEGREDPVILTVMPGKGYKLICEYNESSELLQQIRRGTLLMERASVESLKEAYLCFTEAEALAPNDWRLLLLKCETQLILAIINRITNLSTYDARQHENSAAELAFRAERANADCAWQRDIFLGVLCLLRCEPPSAASYFQSAFNSNPRDSYDSLWFAMFLVGIGRRDTARAIMERRLVKNPLGKGINLAAACLYYAFRELDKALESCEHAISMDGSGSDFANLILGLIHLARNNGQKAFNAFNQVGSKMWILEFRKKYFVEEVVAGARLVVGLQALSLAEMSSPDAVEEWIRREVAPRIHWPPPTTVEPGHLKIRMKPPAIQCAMVYLALERHERALVCLRRAHRDRDFLVNWIETLSVFAPLRGHPRFEAIALRIDWEEARRNYDDKN